MIKEIYDELIDIKKITEYFVNYYGEERRMNIEEKLNECTIVLFPKDLQAYNVAKYVHLLGLDEEKELEVISAMSEFVERMRQIRDSSNYRSLCFTKDELNLLDLLGFDPKDIAVNPERKTIFYIPKLGKRYNELIAFIESFYCKYHIPPTTDKIREKRYKLALKKFVKDCKRLDGKSYELNIEFLLSPNGKQLFEDMVSIKESIYELKADSCNYCVMTLNLMFDTNANNWKEILNDAKYSKILKNIEIARQLYAIDEISEAYSKRQNPYRETYELIKDKIPEISFNNVVEHLINDSLGLAFSTRHKDKLQKYCMISIRDVSYKTIIHELNHVLSMYVPKNNTCPIEANAGFDILSTNESPRKYENFNEAVNEYLTYRICENIDKKDIIIPFDLFHSYLRGCGVMKNFLDAYEPEIKKYYISSNPMKFRELIGADKFDALASLVDKYMSKNMDEENYLIESIEKKLNLEIEDLQDFIKIKNYITTIQNNLTHGEVEYITLICDILNLCDELVQAKNNGYINCSDEVNYPID